MQLPQHENSNLSCHKFSVKIQYRRAITVINITTIYAVIPMKSYLFYRDAVFTSKYINNLAPNYLSQSLLGEEP